MFQISGQTALDFLWLGKEATMSPDWIHYSRALHEYELMIIDEGVLYIADEFGKYTVSKGEYILMAPCRHQYGWKPSCCAFHWLGFPSAGYHLPIRNCRFPAPNASKNTRFLQDSGAFVSDLSQ